MTTSTRQGGCTTGTPSAGPVRSFVVPAPPPAISKSSITIDLDSSSTSPASPPRRTTQHHRPPLSQTLGHPARDGRREGKPLGQFLGDGCDVHSSPMCLASSCCHCPAPDPWVWPTLWHCHCCPPSAKSHQRPCCRHRGGSSEQLHFQWPPKASRHLWSAVSN